MRLYLHAQLGQRRGGDPEALGLLVVDLGLLLRSHLLVGQMLVRRSQLLVRPLPVSLLPGPQSSLHRLTRDAEGLVLLGRYGGVDLLAEGQEILLKPAVEVSILEVLLVPETIETIKIKSRN